MRSIATRGVRAADTRVVAGRAAFDIGSARPIVGNEGSGMRGANGPYGDAATSPVAIV